MAVKKNAAGGKHELERLLGCRVDLATPGMIRKELSDRIYEEAVRAA